MERVLPGEAVRGPAEVPEWADLAGEEWGDPEPVQVRLGNALALNVERVSLMKWGYPVMIANVPNAGQKW